MAIKKTCSPLSLRNPLADLSGRIATASTHIANGDVGTGHCGLIWAAKMARYAARDPQYRQHHTALLAEAAALRPAIERHF